ncbi:MAG: DUF1641 domain-containing protein [Nostocoides sp.]
MRDEPTLSAQPSNTTALQERLNDPAVAGALATILDHADLLAVMVEGLNGFTARSEIIGESLLASLNDARSMAEAPDSPVKGLDFVGVAGALRDLANVMPKVAPVMLDIVGSGIIDEVMHSGITEPKVIDQVGKLGRGLAKGAENASANHLEVDGPFKLMRLLKDPDIARGLGFFLNVLKSMGAELGSSTTPTAR